MTPHIMLIRKKKIEINATPGFLLLLGILFYLDDGSGIMGWGCTAAAVHEIGHVTVCVLLGGRVEALSLSLVGAELRFSYPSLLSYGRENVVLLSGAIFNLLAGLVALCFGGYLPALLSFALGGFNLLPIVPLDGGRILINLISARFDPECADQIANIISGIFVGMIAGIGLIAATKYANMLLLGLSVWLLLGIIKKKRNFLPNK